MNIKQKHFGHTQPSLNYKTRGTREYVSNWFSNMIPVDIVIDNIKYNSVETFYQAQKSLSINVRKQIAVMDPHKSKSFARTITMRSDWESIKVNVMRVGLEAKFSQTKWKIALLATVDNPIIEWNNWGDKFWGVTTSDNIGANVLGQLLMNIRTNTTFNVVVGGSRHFKDMHKMQYELSALVLAYPNLHIISGGAAGADELAHQFAEDRYIKSTQVFANWSLHGKAAGFIRNAEMLKLADAVVVFWDGKSPGTEHMLRIAKESDKKLKIVNYKEHE